ncbi:ABC transporter substrate-binding protein [Paenibacillus sp. SYP-B4298]|uniref:ABC transporter substrate-binding protein n=1 Tax=Paenibacillus sp. SYP-B4298 TaxID=2996034 RepID=UPI0022DD1EE2|nr:ABC transporter substrate-binding protein [Paenibacillus sp. SYP-B4298]
MPKMRKWTAIVLAATLVGALLAGCAQKEQKEQQQEKAASNAPIVMTFYSEDPSPNWAGMEDEVGRVITEKTGIKLKAEFAVGDAQQKSALIASSGTFPDLISAKGSINKMVDAGGMRDLTDLIEEHGPNIKKLFGKEMKRLRYSLDDPSIYVIPTYSAVDNVPFKAEGGFELQHRVVKELGYPTIRTVKDFENAIKAYLEKHPTDENGNPNIGLSLIADDWRMYISVTNPAFYTTGGPDDGETNIDIETQKVTYHYRRPAEKEYFRWLNHMNAEGLLDKESFVQKSDQYKAKIASGRVLGLIDQQWGYDDGEKAIKKEGKFEHGYGHYPVTLTEETKDTSYWPTGFMAGYGVGISVDNPDPVAAIKFLDFLCSEEGQVLVNWGVEGKHYVVEDGKRIIPEDVINRKVNDAAKFQQESGIGTYINMGGRYGHGVKDSTGNYYTTEFPEQIIAEYNEVEKETLAAYGVSTWIELFPKPEEFPVRPWGAAWNIPVPSDSEVSILQEKLKNITWKRIPQIILAAPSEFDKLWDEYMAELEKAGVERMEQGFEKFVKDRVKLWND